MELRPHRVIKEEKLKRLKLAIFQLGKFFISVQSMTNTLTTDIKGTINQINSLDEAGADIVRVSCPDEKSTKSLKEIIKEIKVPLLLIYIFITKELSKLQKWEQAV